MTKAECLVGEWVNEVECQMVEEEEWQEPEKGPSWKTIWFSELDSYSYPADLWPYGPGAYEAYWEAWLAEVQQPPPQDYYYIQNEEILNNRT